MLRHGGRGQCSRPIVACRQRTPDGQYHPNRCCTEPGQFRRAAGELAGRSHWRQHGRHSAGEGICFAIASNTAKLVATQLIAYGKFRRSYIGVAAQNVPLPRWLTRKLDLLQTSAVQVLSAEPGGPAERAGLEEGDLIVELDGRTVGSIDELHAQLTEARTGLPTRLAIVREEEKREVTIVPAEAGRPGR